VLAEVAGVEVCEYRETLWIVPENDTAWTPLTDHNQMALVKAGLVGEGYGLRIVFYNTSHFYEATIRSWPVDQTVSKFWTGIDKDELRAFAKAVVAMKEGRMR
jgi:hypothetical protein